MKDKYSRPFDIDYKYGLAKYAIVFAIIINSRGKFLERVGNESLWLTRAF